MGRRIEVLLDARPRAAFVRGHAPNAANLPMGEWDARAAELPPRDAAVTLIADEVESAARDLLSRGFQEVHAQALDDASEQGPPRVVAWRPSPALERCAARLPTSGRALDVACGAGREATWLAARGLFTLGLDLLPDALVRANRLARASSELADPPRGAVHFACADVTRPLPVRDHGFELVCGFRYLDRLLFGRAHEWLAPGGHILWQTFSARTPADRHPRRAAFRLEPGELVKRCEEAGFSVQDAWEDGDMDGIFATKDAGFRLGGGLRPR